jgi:hypothetical protein
MLGQSMSANRACLLYGGLVLGFLGSLYLLFHRVQTPNLPLSEAAKIISHTPEFNQSAQLLDVQFVNHLPGSMDTVSYGQFRFVRPNSAPDAAPIIGQAEFRYREGTWHLNWFDSGCNYGGRDSSKPTSGCHTVYVKDSPE